MRGRLRNSGIRRSSTSEIYANTVFVVNVLNEIGDGERRCVRYVVGLFLSDVDPSDPKAVKSQLFWISAKATGHTRIRALWASMGPSMVWCTSPCNSYRPETRRTMPSRKPIGLLAIFLHAGRNTLTRVHSRCKAARDPISGPLDRLSKSRHQTGYAVSSRSSGTSVHRLAVDEGMLQRKVRSPAAHGGTFSNAPLPNEKRE